MSRTAASPSSSSDETLPRVAGPQAPTIRYVDASDPTCGGLVPCHATIQAAVDAAQPGDTIRIQGGTYPEQLSISSKNRSATSEAERIVIEADPAAAAGSAVLDPPTTHCTQGHAVRFQQSKLITLRRAPCAGSPLARRR